MCIRDSCKYIALILSNRTVKNLALNSKLRPRRDVFIVTLTHQKLPNCVLSLANYVIATALTQSERPSDCLLYTSRCV